ncbi:MAG: hypothetical protein WC879_06435 [Melioribacteraceae bacterium]
MQATSLIVEMLIVGIIACCWIVLFLFKLSIIDFTDILNQSIKWQNWSALITIVLTAIFYQVGWMVNWMGSSIVSLFLEKRLMDKVFVDSKKIYPTVRANINQKGSDNLHRELNLDRGVIRLSRSGIINFLLLSIALCLLGYYKIFFITLFCFIVCTLQWYSRYNRYYNRMFEASKLIQSNYSDDEK